MKNFNEHRYPSFQTSQRNYVASISRGIYIRPLALALASILIMDFDVEGGTGPVFGTLGLIFVFPAFLAQCWIHAKSHRYCVTGSGLQLNIGSWAMLRRSESFIPKHQIEATSAEQGILGRIFNYGHVYVTATGSRYVVLKWVRNPKHIVRRINDLATTLS